MIIYTFFKCVLFITRLLWLVGRLGSRKPVQPYQLLAIVTPTDRPKSVHSCCVIKVFGKVFVLSRCFLDFSVGVGAFDIGLSPISSFFTFDLSGMAQCTSFRTVPASAVGELRTLD